MTRSGTPPAGSAAVSLRILHVADCPQLAPLRARLDRVLARLDLHTTIQEIQGSYPSPTLLINGVDVLPRPAGGGACCRLDLPTEEQIVAALTAVTGHRAADRLRSRPT